MRTLVQGFPHDWQIEIIKRCNLRPVYWIASDLNNRHLFPEETILHSAADAIKGIPPEKLDIGKIGYLDDLFYRENLELVDVVTKMFYIRRDYFSHRLFTTFNHTRRFLYKQVPFWKHVLDSLNIELVLLEDIPHYPHDYIIYHLAKLKQIKVVFFHTVGEPTRLFICESMDNLTPNEPVYNLTRTEKIEPITRTPLYNVKRKRTWSQSLASKRQRLKKLFTTDKAESLAFLKKRCINDLFRLKNKILELRYKYEYNKYIVHEIPSGNYIYFALSVQPEVTSYPPGKNFEDQIYAVEYLSELLPNDVLVLVKEHPDQRPNCGRHIKYYRDLVAIDKVKLIDMKFSSFDLIKKCKAVATIAGQAGWEALTNGKPVITFGVPWYQNCPYVYHIDEIKKNPSILSQKIEVDLDKINKFYLQFMNSTYEGYVNPDCMPSSRLSINENIEAVASAINKKLET